MILCEWDQEGVDSEVAEACILHLTIPSLVARAVKGVLTTQWRHQGRGMTRSDPATDDHKEVWEAQDFQAEQEWVGEGILSADLGVVTLSEVQLDKLHTIARGRQP